jgi:hypothetical protein
VRATRPHPAQWPTRSSFAHVEILRIHCCLSPVNCTDLTIPRKIFTAFEIEFRPNFQKTSRNLLECMWKKFQPAAPTRGAVRICGLSQSDVCGSPTRARTDEHVRNLSTHPGTEASFTPPVRWGIRKQRTKKVFPLDTLIFKPGVFIDLRAEFP